MGRIKRIKSPTMEKPAFVYQKIVVFKHTPLMLLSHVRGIGVHWKIEARVVAVPNAATKPIRIQHIMRKRS